MDWLRHIVLFFAAPPRRRAALTQPQRPAVLAAALAPLWCLWFYCDNQAGNALFWLAAAVATLAVALPRPLRLTTRGIIWIALGLAVACLAANIERISPAKGDYLRLYLLDRVATALLASAALGALFFKIDRAGITRLWVGVLPLAMLTAGRNSLAPRPDIFITHYFLPGLIVTLALGELAQQGSVYAAAERKTLPTREKGARLLWIALAAALSFLLAPPLGTALQVAQSRVAGLFYHHHTSHRWRPAAEMVLSHRLPSGFHRRDRLLLTVRSHQSPGYLRESVYTIYEGGRWLEPESGVVLAAATAPDAFPGEAYSLAPRDPGAVSATFTLISPGSFRAIPLPGGAAVLHLDPYTIPHANPDGMVTTEDAAPPARYTVIQNFTAAFPEPSGTNTHAYLTLPAGLEEEIRKWAAGVEGLSRATSAAECARVIARHFARHYQYHEDALVSRRPDPLVNFMRDRRGFCIHFASATALMLRARGYPTRVVGGYASAERAPWLRSWAVRERHGHAWVEAWDPVGKHWLLVDTTPPHRLPDGALRVAPHRRLLDLLGTGWKNLRLLLDKHDPLRLMADTSARLGLWLYRHARGWHAIALAATLAAYAIWHRRRPRGATRHEYLRAKLARTAQKRSRKLGGSVGPRRHHETWEAWLQRLQLSLPADKHAAIAELFEQYQQIRYCREIDPRKAKKWISAPATAYKRENKRQNQR